MCAEKDVVYPWQDLKTNLASIYQEHQDLKASLADVRQEVQEMKDCLEENNRTLKAVLANLKGVQDTPL